MYKSGLQKSGPSKAFLYVYGPNFRSFFLPLLKFKKNAFNLLKSHQNLTNLTEFESQQSIDLVAGIT